MLHSRWRTRDEELEHFLANADHSSASELVQAASAVFGQGLVLSTSFGIQSAVMLHLVTQIVPGIPVVWIDTGYLFPETYLYAQQLTEQLHLNLKVFQAEMSPARMEALMGRIWQENQIDALDRYDQIRKVEPMQRALTDLRAEAWLAGLRSSQTDHRKSMQRVHKAGNRFKILPILHWNSRQVHTYLVEHQLPIHPLFERGYVTVGDWHSSRPLKEEDSHHRDTRYRGIKQECGLHLELDSEAAKSLDSSEL